MRGRNSAVVSLVAALLTTTAVALAAPVSVVSVSDGASEFVGRLASGEPLTYAYRQSIYEVAVLEQLARDGDRIAIRSVRSSDIRSLEYFGWGGAPARTADGLWVEEAPSSVAPSRELVIRITPAGEQLLATARWSVELRPRFGETVVRVRAETRPWLVALLEGVTP